MFAPAFGGADGVREVDELPDWGAVEDAGLFWKRPANGDEGLSPPPDPPPFQTRSISYQINLPIQLEVQPFTYLMR